jgi:hypothetical protein
MCNHTRANCRFSEFTRLWDCPIKCYVTGTGQPTTVDSVCGAWLKKEKRDA